MKKPTRTQSERTYFFKSPRHLMAKHHRYQGSNLEDPRGPGSEKIASQTVLTAFFKSPNIPLVYHGYHGVNLEDIKLTVPVSSSTTWCIMTKNLHHSTVTKTKLSKAQRWIRQIPLRILQIPPSKAQMIPQAKVPHQEAPHTQERLSQRHQVPCQKSFLMIIDTWASHSGLSRRRLLRVA